MTTIEIKLGVPNIVHTMPLDPRVCITIDGDHALALEILECIEEFTSPAGQIEVK